MSIKRPRSHRAKAILAAVMWLGPLAAAFAQDSGIWVNPKEFKAAPAEPEKPAAASVASEKKSVYAIASAIGGQLSYIVAKQSVGSNLEPYQRTTLPLPDYTLDAIVMRGIDRVIARRFPDTDRVFMRLNPSQLDGVPPQDRERVAFERLTAELQQMPARQQWDRIVVVTPHYRGFERAGLGSKLHGVGMFVQDLNNLSEYEVVEPDGTPGELRRNRYVALYYYLSLIHISEPTRPY